MDRRRRILEGIDLARSTGLEIGDASDPLLAGTENDVYFANAIDTAFVANDRTGKAPADDSRILDVDYGWGEASLQQAAGGRTFDCIVASHIIQCVPDLLVWLRALALVLKPGGTIRLAIPDRRFTTDRFRRDTGIVEVLDAYLRAARRPLPLAILDHAIHSAPVDARAAWREEPASRTAQRHHSLDHALTCARDALEGDAYHDVRCWTFTPSSFADLMATLCEHGLLELGCESLSPTEPDEVEFFVALRHAQDPAGAAARWRAIPTAAEASKFAPSGSATWRSDREQDVEVPAAALQLQVRDLRQALEAVHSSTSWRLTQPLRAIVGRTAQLRRLASAARASARLRGGVLPMVQAALTTIRRDGLSAQLAKLRGHAAGAASHSPALQRDLYERWIARADATDAVVRRRLARETAAWASRPLISVLMPTFDPPILLLERAIASVRAQNYPHWELCIADDASTRQDVREALQRACSDEPRIRLVQRPANGHISAASNSALAVATGDFVALLDHDDELHPLALYWVAREIVEFSDASLIYSDEDKIDEAGRRSEPYFKCDLNYELLLSHNMISHLGVYRRSLLVEIGGFREGFEGSQDYDVALRIIERIPPTQVRHIPKILYHWRTHSGSTAASSDAKPYAMLAGKRALEEHLQRQGLEGTVVEAPEAPNMYRVRFGLPQPEPEVEIIIPTRDRADLMRMSIGSVLEKTTYPNYRICIVDNGSTDPETLRLFDQWREHPRIRIVPDRRPFNFSALNNLAVDSSTSAYVCLLNNDIEVITHDWLSEMMSHASRPGVGCVGARLWYPNQTLQHGGVILGLLGVAGHSHKHLPKGNPGYFGRAVLQQAYSAVTAACLLVRREIYQQAGGLDEQLEVAFNDVDFCLRVGAAGYRNVWTPYAELYHHESVSRGYEDNPAKRARFLREIEIMKRRWAEQLLKDPYYSPNLTMVADDFSIAAA